MPAGGRRDRQRPGQGETNGTVRVVAQLEPSPEPVGRPQPIQVQATQAGTTGWVIALAAGIVLIGTTALRIRQVARERSAGARRARCRSPGRSRSSRGRRPALSRDVGCLTPTRTGRPPTSTARTRLISAGAVMAAGTLLSRVLGFGRFILLVFLFGNGTRQADMFTLANTVPNSMYILLAGGVLNTVLVPQIVRHIKKDSDGGEAYTNRIMTGGLMVLFGITLLLTLAVPYVIALYSAGGWKDPALTAQYQSMVALAYYCMPQIFFYGAYVLAGQILNARDRFGPMMWAPIANNVVASSC